MTHFRARSAGRAAPVVEMRDISITFPGRQGARRRRLPAAAR